MNWFDEFTTVERVKTRYRELAKEFHPDWGGDLEMMKKLNAAYETALKRLNGSESMGTDGHAHTYRYNDEREREIMNIIYALLALRMPDVEIALIGVWIWVRGNTKPYRKQLGKSADGLGLTWADAHQAWYWKPSGWYSRPSGATLEELAGKYGYRGFKPSENEVSVR